MANNSAPWNKSRDIMPPIAWIVALTGVGAVGIGFVAGFVIGSEHPKTYDVAKDFQPIAAAVIAFIGIVVAALTAIAKSRADETTRRVQGAEAASAIVLRAASIARSVGGMAVMISCLEADVALRLFWEQRGRQLKSAIEEARKVMPDLWKDIGKTPIPGHEPIRAALTPVDIILRETEMVAHALEEYITIDAKRTPEQLFVMDSAAFQAIRWLQKVEPTYRVGEPARPHNRKRWEEGTSKPPE